MNETLELLQITKIDYTTKVNSYFTISHRINIALVMIHWWVYLEMRIFHISPLILLITTSHTNDSKHHHYHNNH